MEDQAQSLIDATSKCEQFSLRNVSYVVSNYNVEERGAVKELSHMIIYDYFYVTILAAAFKAGKIPANPFGAPGKGVAIPPPGMLPRKDTYLCKLDIRRNSLINWHIIICCSTYGDASSARNDGTTSNASSWNATNDDAAR